MKCNQCDKELVETSRTDYPECVNVEYSCPTHGLQIITSHSKRVYMRSGSYIDKDFKLPEIKEDND